MLIPRLYDMKSGFRALAGPAGGGLERKKMKAPYCSLGICPPPHPPLHSFTSVLLSFPFAIALITRNVGGHQKSRATHLYPSFSYLMMTMMEEDK